jgi:apolipoprotein N-acyltransferase
MRTSQLSSRGKPRATTDANDARVPTRAWWQSTLAIALLGQLLLWAAFPPLEVAPLAWLAPVPWVWLVRRWELSGKRPYLALWLSSFVFHLAVFYWVTLPHWATSFGWLALSFYLALYFPLFIGLCRVAVQRLRLPVILLAPVVWTGLEFAKAHLLTGFNMGALGHTQYRWPQVIQISDLEGGYAVSFLIVFVGACLAQMLPLDGRRRAWWPLVPLAAVMAAVLAYGDWRLGQDTITPGPKVALIQGSIDIDMKHDPEEADEIFTQYYGLSKDAVREHADLDLIVWPETMFRDAWLTFDPKFAPPKHVNWTVADAEESSRSNISRLVAPLGTPFLIGIDTWHYKPGSAEQGKLDHFNSALFTDRDGNVVGRYDKCHLVPFGEYVWLASTFPWLYNLTPLHGGSLPGVGAECVEIGGVRYAANICYENTLPHFIRGQVAALKSAGKEPQVLVNLTNDGWFWGSAELDMHLACAVFRAVECRKPFLIAANTGFSAAIDSNGRILQQGPRRDTAVLVDRVGLDSRQSPYVDQGDWPAGLCLLATCGVAVAGWWTARQDRRRKPDPAG